MSMDRLFQTIGKKSGKFLKNNASTILSCLGTVGVIATAALAVKATPKAVELIRADSRINHDGDPDAFTKEEAVKSCWKCYIPAVTVGASTIACILSANVLSRKQQAALVSSYGMIGKAYGEYQKKVKEKYGKEAHEDILREIAAEKSKGRMPYAQGLAVSSSLEFEGADEELRLFYDQFGDRYFQATISQVLQAEYHLNRNFALRGSASLNEFYSFLDIELVKGGDAIGWYVNDDEFYWIDFDHVKADFDDGLDCWIISPVFAPGTEEDYGVL